MQNPAEIKKDLDEQLKKSMPFQIHCNSIKSTEQIPPFLADNFSLWIQNFTSIATKKQVFTVKGTNEIALECVEYTINITIGKFAFTYTNTDLDQPGLLRIGIKLASPNHIFTLAAITKHKGIDMCVTQYNEETGELKFLVGRVAKNAQKNYIPIFKEIICLANGIDPKNIPVYNHNYNPEEDLWIDSVNPKILYMTCTESNSQDVEKLSENQVVQSEADLHFNICCNVPSGVQFLIPNSTIEIPKGVTLGENVQISAKIIILHPNVQISNTTKICGALVRPSLPLPSTFKLAKNTVVENKELSDTEKKERASLIAAKVKSLKVTEKLTALMANTTAETLIDRFDKLSLSASGEIFSATSYETICTHGRLAILVTNGECDAGGMMRVGVRFPDRHILTIAKLSKPPGYDFYIGQISAIPGKQLQKATYAIIKLPAGKKHTPLLRQYAASSMNEPSPFADDKNLLFCFNCSSDDIWVDLNHSPELIQDCIFDVNELAEDPNLSAQEKRVLTIPALESNASLSEYGEITAADKQSALDQLNNLIQNAGNENHKLKTALGFLIKTPALTEQEKTEWITANNTLLTPPFLYLNAVYLSKDEKTFAEACDWAAFADLRKSLDVHKCTDPKHAKELANTVVSFWVSSFKMAEKTDATIMYMLLKSFPGALALHKKYPSKLSLPIWIINEAGYKHGHSPLAPEAEWPARDKEHFQHVSIMHLCLPEKPVADEKAFWAAIEKRYAVIIPTIATFNGLNFDTVVHNISFKTGGDAEPFSGRFYELITDNCVPVLSVTNLGNSEVDGVMRLGIKTEAASPNIMMLYEVHKTRNHDFFIPTDASFSKLPSSKKSINCGVIRTFNHPGYNQKPLSTPKARLDINCRETDVWIQHPMESEMRCHSPEPAPEARGANTDSRQPSQQRNVQRFL